MPPRMERGESFVRALRVSTTQPQDMEEILAIFGFLRMGIGVKQPVNRRKREIVLEGKTLLFRFRWSLGRTKMAVPIDSKVCIFVVGQLCLPESRP